MKNRNGNHRRNLQSIFAQSWWHRASIWDIPIASAGQTSTPLPNSPAEPKATVRRTNLLGGLLARAALFLRNATIGGLLARAALFLRNATKR